MTALARLAALGLLLSIPAVASAQTPAFKDLATRLAPGSRVQVLDVSGRTISGRIQKIGDEEIVVAAETNTIAVPARDVSRIAIPRHGKRNGFLIGAALGTFVGVESARFVDGSGAKVAMPLMGVGVYGAIGLGLGSLWPAQRVVYRAPGASGTSIAMTPPSRGIGLGMTLRW